jgi:hypothetical protein
VNITGLTSGTVYKAYVRQDCDGNNTTFSNNSYGPATFTTGPGCGSNFYDVGGPSGNYPDAIFNTGAPVTICPDNATDKVLVSFSSFQTESGFDPLYVYNGPNTSSPQIASTNGNPGGAYSPNPGPGGWWGTTAPTNTGIPGVVLATGASGCLTFKFGLPVPVGPPRWRVCNRSTIARALNRSTAWTAKRASPSAERTHCLRAPANTTAVRARAA